MVNFTINENLFVVKSDISIIESCKFTGIQIPRFCYQEGLSIAGNCRMCLVELENSEKLVIACLTNIESNLHVITNSLAVKKARENILETLLLNHPLDCPICDQGGECDLQDQTKIFGNYFNKMFSDRRGVEDKKFGTLIKTIMTRCIHCTRCVRYSTEILGVENIGTLNRGNLTEIGSYSSKYLESPISGNIIDLCPVGALTSAPHAFQTRPWELRSAETIDLTDSLGSNIFVNFKESEIIRVLPKPNSLIGNIISNKARFSYDSLLNNRLYEKNNFNFKQWNNLLDKYYTSKKKFLNLLILINEQLDLKTINNLKFLNFLDQQIKVRSFSRYNQYKNINFFINNSIKVFEKTEHVCSVIVGSTIQTENDILNTKLRLKVLNQDFFIYATNSIYGLKNDNYFVNLKIEDILLLIEGKFNILSRYLIGYRQVIFLISENIKKRIGNNNSIKTKLKSLNNKIFILDITSSISTETCFFLGIKSLNLRDLLVANHLFLININENIILRKLILIFKGKIFSFNSHYSNISDTKLHLIPKASEYFETSGVFLNLEQKFKKSQKILSCLNNNNDFKIFVKEVMNHKKFKFEYLDFINSNFVVLNNDSISKIFLNSFFRKKTNIQEIVNISYYPIKLSFQDISKVDNFIKNSYSINISSLYSRFGSF